MPPRWVAWWSQVLGWPHDVDDDGDVVLHAPPGAGVNWMFIAVPDEKVVKNRIHLDFRPDDQQAEVDRVTGSGCAPRRHRAAWRRELGGAGRSGGQRILHPRRRRLRSCAFAAALTLILAVCGSTGASAQPPGPVTPTDVAAPDIGPGASDTTRRVAARRYDTLAVRHRQSDCGMARSDAAHRGPERIEEGRSRGHRHPDQLRVAVEGISAAAVRRRRPHLRERR